MRESAAGEGRRPGRRKRDAIMAFEYERVTARPKSSCVPARPELRPRAGPAAPVPNPIATFATSEEDPMKITRDFRPLTDRYAFDTGPCSYANGFAQIDTRQDASYYGTWCSPVARTIVSFCEGDVTTTVCETDAEFVEQLREAARWNDEAGYGPDEDRRRVSRRAAPRVREARPRGPAALSAAPRRSARRPRPPSGLPPGPSSFRRSRHRTGRRPEPPSASIPRPVRGAVPGADFAEAVRRYEAAIGRALSRAASLPSFGAVTWRRFLGWLLSPNPAGL